jgi:hypothetical protein
MGEAEHFAEMRIDKENHDYSEKLVPEPLYEQKVT